MREKKPKQERFNFAQMKEAATSENLATRKQAFTEYFERFEEFPSFLFDNEEKIDAQLFETIQALLKDPATSKEMHKGIEALLHRLPSDR